VLPMDLQGSNRGDPDQDLEEQHIKLARVAKEYSQVIPFFHIDPNSSSMGGPPPLPSIKRFIEEGESSLTQKE